MPSEHLDEQAELERLAAIVSSSDDAIISKNLSGIILSWNKGAEKIFGYSEAEMVGQSILRIIPPELQQEEEHILGLLRNGERVDHFETQRLTRDGRRLHVSLTVSPLRNRLGNIVGASKIARDITERKRAEELQSLLIAELNHRVKNTLAVVQSIATQTLAGAPDPEAFVSAFRERLRALAQAHDLLVREDLAGVNLRDLLEEELALRGGERDRCAFHGPDLLIEGDLATHMCLVIHELATNARKYGSLSQTHGRLRVDWRTEACDAGQRLALTWTETGICIQQTPGREGFGTSLLRRVADANGGQSLIEQAGTERRVRLELLLNNPRQPKASSGKSTGRDRGAARDAADLRDRQVLVVDDEVVVAMDIAAALEAAGSSIVGPAYNIDQALQTIGAQHIDLAIVDANLKGRSAQPVAEALAQRRIPFILATGYGPESLPAGWSGSSYIAKPFTIESLVQALGELERREKPSALQ